MPAEVGVLMSSADFPNTCCDKIPQIDVAKACFRANGGLECWTFACPCSACLSKREGYVCEQDAQSVETKLTLVQQELNMTYEITGLHPHDLPVKGAYIDPRITTGFTYGVRCADSLQLVFPTPLRLVSVGMGYGRRMTFKGETLNKNSNFFWSDSHEAGYAFSIRAKAVKPGHRMAVVDTNGDLLACVQFLQVCPEQLELESVSNEEGITKRVHLAFLIKITKSADADAEVLCDSIPSSGVAILHKEPKGHHRAKLVSVENVLVSGWGSVRLLELRKRVQTMEELSSESESDDSATNSDVSNTEAALAN